VKGTITAGDKGFYAMAGGIFLCGVALLVADANNETGTHIAVVSLSLVFLFAWCRGHLRVRW
jgi:hypothetical protein